MSRRSEARAVLVVLSVVLLVAGLPFGAFAVGGAPPADVSAQSISVILPGGLAAGDHLGAAVAMHGNLVAIGAPYDDVAALTNCGMVYVYERRGLSWALIAQLTPADPASGDLFGSSVAVYNDTIVIGAHAKNANDGAAYVFTRSAGLWSQQAKLAPAAAGSQEHVGYDVAISQDTAVIGTWGPEKAYVYARSGSAWTKTDTFMKLGGTGSEFGTFVDIYRDTAVIGAPQDDDAVHGVDSGAVYVYARSGGLWSLQAQLTAADGSASDRFGTGVSVFRDTFIAGSPNDDDRASNAGAAYAFTRSGTTWTQQDKMTASDGAADDGFGRSISLSGDAVIIGAPDRSAGMGAAYGFIRYGAEWLEEGMVDTGNAAGDRYGAALSLSGGAIVAGALWSDTAAVDAGAAYLYLPEPFVNTGVKRVAGLNRYTTAVEVSKWGFALGAPAAVVATGENWPDALGGSALAGAVRGPLLLTRKATLPAEVAAEIKRLGATRVYVLGSTAAVSTEVENALVALMGRSDVVRLGGGDRYGTAQVVADRTIGILGAGYGHEIAVATGVNFPDATAFSPVAYWTGTPIVLANPRTGAVYVPPTTFTAKVLGSAAAVPDDVETALVADLGATHVARLEGTNRYATAVEIAEYGVAEGLLWNGVGLASGTAFPDALSGGPMLASFGSVLLLTDPLRLSPATADSLEAHQPDIWMGMHVIGGPPAVSAPVAESARVAAGL